MLKWNKKRKDMTQTELTEHKRQLRQNHNAKYYQKKKIKQHQHQQSCNNKTNDIKDDDIDLLSGLYELYNITQDANELEDVEQSIIQLEHALNIPLEQRLIYHLYNGDDNSDDD